MSDASQLAKMANDIGDFFRAQPPSEAVTGIANHIRSYWTRRMRDKLSNQLARNEVTVDALPRAALELLAQHPQAAPDQPPGGDAG